VRFASYAVATFAAAFLTTALFEAAFLRLALFVAESAGVSFSAFFAAQRFRAASAIACLPASLIWRFALAGTVTGVGGTD
jgi:hypothetical protein